MESEAKTQWLTKARAVNCLFPVAVVRCNKDGPFLAQALEGKQPYRLKAPCSLFPEEDVVHNEGGMDMWQAQSHFSYLAVNSDRSEDVTSV